MRLITGETQYSSLRDRFLAQVIPVTESGCWLWTGTCSRIGYGMIKDHYKNRTIHRVSYELFVGPIPSGMCVCHRCDVRCCANPGHLFLGTYRENNADMVNKGRARSTGHAGLRGEAHPLSRLSVNDVAHIRSSSESAAFFATRYGTTRENIYAIRKKRTWRHV